MQDKIKEIAGKLALRFGGKLCCVGVQGSFARGEERRESDLDLVVVLKTLNQEDIAEIRRILDETPFDHPYCGFIAGADVLSHWDKADRLTLYYDTAVVWGTLPLSRPTKADLEAAVVADASALYHLLCHSLLFSQEVPQMDKKLFFLLRTVVLRRTGCFYRSHEELSSQLTEREQALFAASREEQLAYLTDLLKEDIR